MREPARTLLETMVNKIMGARTSPEDGLHHFPTLPNPLPLPDDMSNKEYFVDRDWALEHYHAVVAGKCQHVQFVNHLVGIRVEQVADFAIQ